MTNFTETLRNISLLSFAALLISTTGSASLYAEDTAAVSETASDSGQAQDARSNRKERFEKYLENHPKAAERMDKNNDGTVDKSEMKRAHEMRQKNQGNGRDNDNNPPGMKGGPGTNWENRPGFQGGAGANPNRQGGFEQRRDNDNNPPGMRGGQGTNWENRPGPQGGAGASPNRQGGGKKK